MKNTFIFAAVTGPLSYLLCFIFAWLINELRPGVRALLTLLFYAPSISGNAYMIWHYIFSGDMYGYLNGVLLKWGIIDKPLQWLIEPEYIMPIVVMVALWMSLGTSFLVFIAERRLDPTLFEAAAIDGVRNRWQELWYITLPSMKSYLMFGAILTITNSFAAAGQITNLVGYPSTDYAPTPSCSTCRTTAISAMRWDTPRLLPLYCLSPWSLRAEWCRGSWANWASKIGGKSP